MQRTALSLLVFTVLVQTTNAQELRGGPANDECGTALPLIVSDECVVVEGNSIGATQSLDPATDCGPDIAGQAMDVWYTFTATAPATVVEVVGMGDYDAVVQVLGGTCDALVPLACADITYPPNNGDTEVLLVPTTIGATYYIRVYDYNGAGSEPVDFTICATNLTTYCQAYAGTCDEYVAQVSVGNFASTSECTEGGYMDYSSEVIELQAGVVVPITVLNGPAVYEEDSVGVWIDWNNDLLFAPSEGTVLSSEDAGYTFTGAIFPPDEALPANVRMRVRIVYDSPPLPCGGSEYGETEDYSVHVGPVTGIGENSTSAGSDWSVFPNPTDGAVNVRFDGPEGLLKLELLDMAGRVLLDEQQRGTKGQVILLSSGQLAAGVYSLRLTTRSSSSEQRLVVR